jgi:glucosamine-6-phosphate deaminase
LTRAGLTETRARLRDAGLAIACVDTRSFFHHPRGPERERALDEARRCLDLAADLGAPGVRVFGDRIQPGQDRESTTRLIAEALALLGEHARPLGREVWIESHGDFARSGDLLPTLELAGEKGVGVLWDPANAFEVGEEPAEGLRGLGERVRHVHLKDLRPLPRAGDGEARAWVPALAGRGDFGPARVLAALKAVGYARWVSFEWEKKWYPAIEDPEVALPQFVGWAAAELRSLDSTAADSRPASPAARCFVRGRLAVEVYADRPAMGRAAAVVVSTELRRLVARDGRAAAVFASAPSQNEFLTALRADATIPWPRITAFHLDEYLGLAPSHPASFRRFLAERLFDHVDVRAFQGLDGEASDPEAECTRYAALLRENPAGLAILGIGENGHLAFIDPPVCDFGETKAVRVVELDPACREQQVHDGAFARIEDVPPRALSLTIPFLMGIARAVAIVPGPAKRTAVAAAVEGPVTCACPASILRRHPDATLFLDDASAAGLGG